MQVHKISFIIILWSLEILEVNVQNSLCSFSAEGSEFGEEEVPEEEDEGMSSDKPEVIIDQDDEDVEEEEEEEDGKEMETEFWGYPKG